MMSYHFPEIGFDNYHDHIPNNIIFQRVYSKEETYWHFEYQYQVSSCMSYEISQALYYWCLDNLGAHLGWYVNDWGVIIHSSECALIFELAFEITDKIPSTFP